jgi:hypothetical protein
VFPWELHLDSAQSPKHDGPHRPGTPVRQRRNSIALCGADRLLPGNEEPALGAHLVTPRLAFAHHGIYVGSGRVVHYGALARRLRRAPVEEVPLAIFAHGHALYVRPPIRPRFDCQEVIRRARSRLGEDRYDLLRNNCEHLCEWCVHGVSRSLQIERVLKFPVLCARTIRAAYALICNRSEIFRHSPGVT